MTARNGSRMVPYNEADHAPPASAQQTAADVGEPDEAVNAALDAIFKQAGPVPDHAPTTLNEREVQARRTRKPQAPARNKAPN